MPSPKKSGCLGVAFAPGSLDSISTDSTASCRDQCNFQSIKPFPFSKNSMSIQTNPNTENAIGSEYNFDSDTVSEAGKSPSKPHATAKKRKRKLGSRVNMWIRRIHLFSGLFMLPWVLLYGFTALLFNHPTYMADSKTEIENFSLSNEQEELLPSATILAQQAVATANEKLLSENSPQTLELAEHPNAIFTRQAFGSVENDDRSVGVILNLNNGKGYLRNRSKDPVDKANESEDKTEEAAPPTVDEGLKLAIDADPSGQFKSAVDDLLEPYDVDSEKISLRSLPNLEFDAVVDGKPVRLRLTQQSSRNRRGGGRPSPSAGETDVEKTKPQYKSELTVVGQNPREMSARSFLLRLHMAHGYGVQTNSRWFWAVAVDLMFASMCFWGLSGVVMWWQIKRTRKIGFLLLIASAIVATWLAIGMHWQLVNG